MVKRMRFIGMAGGMAGLVPGLLAAVLLATAGCNAISLKGADAEAPSGSVGGWPFRPAAMRIHPFTSIKRDAEEGALVLEVRIELRDQLGDTTKGVGGVRFELYAREPEASQQGERRRVNVWRAPLRTLEQNRRHYDPITHSYLFRLKLANRPPEDQRLDLTVQFNPRRGQRLRAESTVAFEPGDEAQEEADEQGGGTEVEPDGSDNAGAEGQDEGHDAGAARKSGEMDD